MSRFEIAFYSENSEPVIKTSCTDAESSRLCIEKGLREGTKRAYTATRWGAGPGPDDRFLCFYVNSLGEVFTSSNPFILSRAQALNLRRKPTEGAPSILSVTAKDRRRPAGQGRRAGERRHKGDRRK